MQKAIFCLRAPTDTARRRRRAGRAADVPRFGLDPRLRLGLLSGLERLCSGATQNMAGDLRDSCFSLLAHRLAV